MRRTISVPCSKNFIAFTASYRELDQTKSETFVERVQDLESKETSDGAGIRKIGTFGYVSFGHQRHVPD